MALFEENYPLIALSTLFYELRYSVVDYNSNQNNWGRKLL